MLKRFCYLMLCVSFLHSEETDEVMYHYFILPPSFQNMIQVFGSEYGYNFISNLSGPNHIAFDIGYLGLSSSRPHAFGTKARYEYEYGRNHFHRFGIEAYYHPWFLRINNLQTISLFAGVGSRSGNLPTGTYLDAGILIFPHTFAYLSLNYRVDFFENAPTQHSFRLSLRFPMGIWLVPVVVPALSVVGAYNLSH